MMSTADEIIEQINKDNNIILYKDDLNKHYQTINKKYYSVYITTPKKGKTAFEEILKRTDKNADTKNKTISKLINEITENTKDKKLCIFIDNFEQLTKRELQNYKELEQLRNIILITNINEDKEFIDEQFLDKFIILDEHQFKNNRSQSINLKYVILLILSFIIFLLFLRIQLSILRYIISGLWFTLLMYRSFYYISK